MDQQAQPHVALPDVPAVGDVIAEKYRVEGILGVGGMGVVLGARHLQLGQTVAIKVLSIGKDRQQDAIDRFLREGRAAAALSSDHVIRIYDVGQLPTGIPFMVMERLRGRDLSTVLTEFGPLSVGDAVDYVAQATVAIVEAHEVGIIHRDLKPSNLFLTRRSDSSPCIKVLDFGISKHLSDLDTLTLHGALTSTRQVMGSPAYMSPEQVRDAKTVDHRTDIWALGVTLYELLTHHPAFDADTLPAICAAIAADPPVPVRARRPEVPEAVESIVMRCLEKVPSNRFGSARDLLIALRTWQGRPVEQAPVLRSNRPDHASSAAFNAAMVRDQRASVDVTASGRRIGPEARPQHLHGTLVSGKVPALVQVLDSGGLCREAPTLNRSAANDKHPVVDRTSIVDEYPADRRVENDALNLTSGPIVETLPVPSDILRNRDEAPKPSRRGVLISVAGLFLVGATTIWFVVHREPASSKEVVQRVAQPTVEPVTRFVLRIESSPTAAMVLEGNRPLGVTPLSVEIDRSVVQQSAKQFVVRKDGFVDVSIRQEDSPTDVRQNVSLAKIPATPEPNPLTQATHTVKKGFTRSSMKPLPHATNPTPGSTAPQIRTAR